VQRSGEEVPGVSDEQVSGQLRTKCKAESFGTRSMCDFADSNALDYPRNLMAQEDLSKLGFKERDKHADQKGREVRSDGKKPRGGFVAGIPKQ